MPQAFLPHLSRMVDALLAQDTPMLVHCTAGKDRTGVVVALFLDLLAVPRPVIMEDYRKSDIFGQNLRVSGHLKRDLQKTFGFVPPDDAYESATVTAAVRGNPVVGTIVKLPFVPHRYFRKPA